MASFLTLEYAISTTTGHAGNIQQLRAVDHMVVYQETLATTHHRVLWERTEGLTLATSDTNTFGFYLETKTSFILPQCCRDPRVHARWSNLTCSVELVLRRIALSWSACRGHVIM